MGRLAASWFLGVVALAGCTADRPDLVAGDGSVEVPCSPFADLVVEYKPAGGDNDPAAAAATLGAPDDDAVAVGPDTVLTLAFVGLGAVIDADGADVGVAVVGLPADGTVATGYLSADGETFHFAGDLDPDGTTLDLAIAGLASAGYVRLVGLSGELAVDAVEAVQTTCTASAF